MAIFIPFLSVLETPNTLYGLRSCTELELSVGFAYVFVWFFVESRLSRFQFVASHYYSFGIYCSERLDQSGIGQTSCQKGRCQWFDRKDCPLALPRRRCHGEHEIHQTRTTPGTFHSFCSHCGHSKSFRTRDAVYQSGQTCGAMHAAVILPQQGETWPLYIRHRPQVREYIACHKKNQNSDH